MAASEKQQTLKTTAAVGSGQIITILAGIIRTKVAAIILGPTGVGIVGILTMATDIIRNISSLGIPLSGVREISIAESTGDRVKMSFAVEVFNKWILFTALIGGILCMLLGFPLSLYLFGDYEYGWAFVFLSMSVFFGTLTTGRIGVLQGKRAIAYMVKANLYGAIFSSFVVIAIYLIFAERGIVPGIIVASIINFVTVLYFYIKADISQSKTVSLVESFPYAKEMIKIGFFTIIVGVFDQVMNLGLRSFVTVKSGTEGLGLFTAATTVAGMYLTVILSALSSDYLPKLAALKTDKEINNAVNVQLNIVLLLASPFIIGMTGFSDWVVRLLYSNKFLGANLILQWQVIGDFFKIISWPCGYIFLAKGHGKAYTIYSIFATAVYVGIIGLCWDLLGFSIIGFAFFVSQLLGAVITYIFFNRLYAVMINKENIVIIIIMGSLLAVNYCLHHFVNSDILSEILCGIITLLSFLYAFRILNRDTNFLTFIKQKFKR